jgi:hypothetical protein
MLKENRRVGITLAYVRSTHPHQPIAPMAAAAMDAVRALLGDVFTSADISPGLFVITTHEEAKCVTILTPQMLAPALLARESIVCRYTDGDSGQTITTEFKVSNATEGPQSAPRQAGTSVLWATLFFHPGEELPDHLLRKLYTESMVKFVGLKPVEDFRGFNRKEIEGYPSKQVASNLEFITEGEVRREGFKIVRRMPIQDTQRTMDVQMSRMFCKEWSICFFCGGTLALGSYIQFPQSCACQKHPDGEPIHPKDLARGKGTLANQRGKGKKRARGSVGLMSSTDLW